MEKSRSPRRKQKSTQHCYSVEVHNNCKDQHFLRNHQKVIQNYWYAFLWTNHRTRRYSSLMIQIKSLFKDLLQLMSRNAGVAIKFIWQQQGGHIVLMYMHVYAIYFLNMVQKDPNLDLDRFKHFDVPILRFYLKRRNLSTIGRKDVLVVRTFAAYEANTHTRGINRQQKR